MCVSAIDYKCTECLRFWPCDPVSVLGFKGRPWAVSRSGSTRREGEESATGLCVRLSVPLLFAMFVSWPHESSPPPFHLLAAFGLWCGILFFFQCCEMIPKCWHSSYSRVSTKDYSASHKILNSFHSWWWKTDFSFNFTRRFQHTGKLIFKYYNNDFEGMVFFIPMNSFYIDFKAFFMHFWVILLSLICLTSSRLAFA